MKVAVLSDTHTQGSSRPLPSTAWPDIETAEVILHAGDVGEAELLERLSLLAPVYCVRGNVDGEDVARWGAKEKLELTLAGVVIGMVHDAGPRKGRRERLRQLFPRARVAVFGHSHLPLVDDDGELLLFNPGSPTWPRRAPFPSLGLLWIEHDQVEAEIVPV